MADEGSNQTNNPGFIASLMNTLKPKDSGPIPQKWLDEMLNVSKNVLPAEIEALKNATIQGHEKIVASLNSESDALSTLNKSIGLNFQNTFIDALKKYDKDYGAKEEEKKHTDRKAKDDKDASDRNKKLASETATQLKDNIASTATGTAPNTDLEGAAAAEAALKESKPQPVILDSINPGALNALKSILAPGAAAGVDKEKEKAKAGPEGASATAEGTGIIAAFGKSLGTGIKALAEGVGTGIEALGKGIGNFLSGIGAGLKVLGPGLAALANPQVAIGLGLIILAINGIALAFRLAVPAIQAAMPFFIRIADVIGKVLMHAIDKIPDMLKAIGVAIGTVLKMAGPTIIELAKVIGTYVIAVIKEVGTTITNLAKIAGPIIIEIVKTVKDALIQLAPFVVQLVTLIKEAVIAIAPYVTQIVQAVMEAVKVIVPQLVELGRIIKDVLVGAFNLLKPVLLGLLPIIDKLITFLGNALIKALNIVGPVLKDLAETLKTAVQGISDVLVGIIDLAGNIIDTIRTIFVKGIDGIKGIISVIGNTVQNVIKTIGDTVSGVLTTVADTLERIAAISGAKLISVSLGIGAIAASLLGFSASGAMAGVVGFFTGDNNPLKQLAKIADKAVDFSTIPAALNAIKQSMSDFGSVKVDLDPIKMFINVLRDLKDVLSPTGDNLFSDILSSASKSITGLAKSVAFSAALVASVAATTSTTAQASTKGASAATTTSTAANGSFTTKTTRFLIANEEVKPNGPLSDKQIAVMDQAISFGNVYPPDVMAQYDKQKAEKKTKAGVTTTEAAKLSTVKATTTSETNLEKAVPEGYYDSQIDLLTNIKTELIQLRGVIEKSAIGATNTVSSANSNSTTVVNSVVPTQSGQTTGSRDVPYIERNKYRQDMIYSRGLL